MIGKQEPENFEKAQETSVGGASESSINKDLIEELMAEETLEIPESREEAEESQENPKSVEVVEESQGNQKSGGNKEKKKRASNIRNQLGNGGTMMLCFETNGFTLSIMLLLFQWL